jgi:serine/threonine protein phosphatase PrpC
MEETPETVPVGVPPIGWACGCSRRGISHLRDGRPCQDAHAIWSSSLMGEPLLVVAVADGHGGGKHDLSHCGAALAVQAAVNEVIASLPAPGAGGAWRPVPGEGSGEFQDRVNARWKEYVTADAGRRGEHPSGDIAGQEILTRYGSTLLIALVDRSEVWVGQIGDGDILLVRPGGKVETPLPMEESLLGTVTYSLSSRDPQHLWRTGRFPVAPGGLLILATDGLSDSFEDPRTDFPAFARSLSERVASFGIDRVGSALPAWLDGYSANGSGDDMTIALVSLNAAPEGGAGLEQGGPEEPERDTGPTAGGETDAS